MKKADDGYTYVECVKCGFWYAPGPQLPDCPHESINLSESWLPAFGAAWLQDRPPDAKTQSAAARQAEAQRPAVRLRGQATLASL